MSTDRNNPDIRRSMSRPAARVLPTPVRDVLRRGVVAYRQRGIDPTDKFLASYPKSGSTWVRFVIAQYLADEVGVGFENVKDYVPTLGKHAGAPRAVAGGRLIKTHESTRDSVQHGGKTVYVARDGRDVAVSSYHYLRRLGVYEGDIGAFTGAMLAGRVYPYGTWQDHVSGWLDRRDQQPERVMVLRYEDMLTEPYELAAEALSFLGITVEPERLARAVKENDLESMRSKEARVPTATVSPRARDSQATPFVRSGTARQWMQDLPSDAISRFTDQAGEALSRLGYGTD